MVYAILISYILIVFIGSLRGASKSSNSPESYFLADRSLGTLALFFTILATNFSAFYFLGFAGAGYRIGYAYYVIMALGTGFAALSFYILGTPIWRLGKEHGFITPAELIHHLSSSQILRWLVAIVMLIFTFPYLALQIIGAGYILENVTQGGIPYFGGAVLLTLFTIAYVWIGGMRSVAQTDLKQGLLMILLMIIAVIIISSKLGGLSFANVEVFKVRPELFSRSGAGSFYSDGKWFSLIVFWIFCIPMFPQIFMRFYVAKDVERLKKSAILYGLIPLVISLLPVIIGVLGHLSFPGLEGKETDQILAKMLSLHTPEWFASLVMTGALAAFMSTLDSQLLALSTIMTRDFVLPFKPKIDLKSQVFIGRVWVIVLALIGLAIAYKPFDTIDDMGRLAFGGLAVLFPTCFALIRLSRLPSLSYILSILVGEFLLVGFYMNTIAQKWLWGFDKSLVVILASALIIFVFYIFQCFTGSKKTL